MGRLFGINIRVHVLFPCVAAGVILRLCCQKDVVPGTWIDGAMVMGLLFGSVLLHELGHCVGARWVDGDAHEVLLWPLGGLAFVEVPHTPRANFITVVAGPLTNVLICLIVGLFLVLISDAHVRPPWNPFWYPYRDTEGQIALSAWDGTAVFTSQVGTVVLSRLFYVNWILLLFNVLVIGFPLDGGRMFQCALWPRLGFRQATMAAVYAGFFFAIAIGVYAVVFWDPLTLFLALFIGMTCQRQWLVLEHGGEESLFGYDFSQGYASLEPEPPPRRRRPGFLQRWLQKRAARRLQREQEQREAEERRMDELLEKVQREGLHALNDEERRFLTRVSAKYRNRQ
jgi:Zn-dependent protease